MEKKDPQAPFAATDARGTQAAGSGAKVCSTGAGNRADVPDAQACSTGAGNAQATAFAAGQAQPSVSGNGTVTFYITRHGQTVYNVASRVQGWCDSQLTDEGIRVARLLGRGLAEVPFAQAYCSDAGRAVQTLNAVLAARIKENPQATLPFIHVPDPRLREWCYGNLEAGPGTELHDALTRGFGEDLPFDELNRRLPQVAEVLADQDDTGRAERFDQVKARLESFFAEAGEQTLAAGGGNVLVVTHSFVVRSVMYLLDPSRVNDPLKIKNASVTQVSYDGETFTLGETASTRWLGEMPQEANAIPFGFRM